MYQTPKPEPPIPKNKKCKGPGCSNTLQPISRYGAGHEDAFCSSTCCRAYFGTTIEIATTGTNARRNAKKEVAAR